MKSGAQKAEFTSEQQKLGQTIKRIRQQKGLTQEGVAGEAQINVSYLAKIENGYINTSLRYLIKIARTLEVKVSELFDF